MKTKVSLLIACLLTTLTGFAFTNEKVEGNGNIITQEISISDYNEISTVGVMEFVYEQSDAAPYLKIMIDENLFPLLKAQVDGKELIIGPKKIKENSRNGNSYNLQPTKFKVITNSREIKELNVVSSGDFIIASPINIGKLEINMAGSGYIQIAGKADRAEYNLAASGSIKAYECVTGKTECNIAGSGNIQTHTRNQLEANIVGSGNVYYKGNPTTSKSIIGSGKLKSAN